MIAAVLAHRRTPFGGEGVDLALRRGTIAAISSESLRTVRDRFSEFIERVGAHHERVVITRNDSPAAVLMSPEDLESLGGDPGRA